MSDLVNRLRGKYAVGPIINGEPEFGYRQMDNLPPIGAEAADRIAELEAEVKRLIIIAAHATAEARVASGEFDKADFEMMLVARGFAKQEQTDE